jgi:hypothetical protein
MFAEHKAPSLQIEELNRQDAKFAEEEEEREEREERGRD